MKEYKYPEVLRKLIKDKGITKKQFSIDIMTTESVIQLQLKGETKPRLDTLMDIADYFNVSLDYLVYGDEQVKGERVSK